MQFGQQVVDLDQYLKDHGVSGFGNMDRYRLPLTAAGIAIVVALFAILLSRL